MAKISEKTRSMIVNLVSEKLEEHEEGFNEAYLKAHGDFSFSVTGKISPHPAGNLVRIKLGYTKEKCVDETDGVAEEDQMSLFEDSDIEIREMAQETLDES